MILYYRVQIKEDGVWHNDEAYSPVAVGSGVAQRLIENMSLDDDARLIRVEESETGIDNKSGMVLWVRLNKDNLWVGIGKPVGVQ